MNLILSLRAVVLTSALLLTGASQTWAQTPSKPTATPTTHVLSGLVRGTDGAPLPGASVAAPALGLGTATEADGRFRLELPAGQPVRVTVSFVGYESQVLDVSPRRSDQQHTFMLMATASELGEVVVRGQQTLREKLTTTQMGVERLTIREAKLLPALFGEVDILKTLQLKPGVQNGGEGSSGLFVRGGSSDQNLVLLDNALVYNPNHLFGLFSVFNSDAVQSVDLYKSGFPAQYGGRLSSVVDVKFREGDRQHYRVTGGIGLISSRLSFEGPIAKGKGSFIVSGRRTYFDIFTRAINRRNAQDPTFNPIPDYYFQDFNAKANYELGEKDQVFFTGYVGRDVFGFKSQTSGFDFNFNWGNSLGVVRWQHVFSPELLVNTSASITRYNYEVKNRIDQFSFNLGSNILDYTGRVDFDYVPRESKHVVKFGLAGTRHRFGVGRLQAGADDGSFNFGSDLQYTGLEGGVYGSVNSTWTDKWQTELGLRGSGFRSGTDQYGGLEPRASARYSLRPNLSLKASYALMYQYVHLVSNSGASLPTDIWYPSRLNVRPQRSQQLSTGVSWLIGESGKYLLTNEVYYKWGRNQVDFRDGAQLFVNPSLDAEFLFGRGWSYGNEVYLEKKEGRTTGWIGYTLAWAYRNFPPQRGTTGVNNGQDFNPTYDRRHNLTVVVLHQLSQRVNLTASFVYTSGAPTTLPLGRFATQDVFGGDIQANPIYPDRNTYRLIPYHRLDLGVVYKLRPSRTGGERDLTFSLYNAYNRRNAYFIFFETQRDKATDRITGFAARQVSLFPAIPSVTYNFKF